ncbi:hypothetical protein ACFLSQ_00890 [Bacteroidota bacterium]
MKTKENKIENQDVMLDEYDFDYSKAKPNKFAKDFYHSTIKVYDKGKLIKEMKPVLVETDIIMHFKTSKGINKALRSLIHT